MCPRPKILGCCNHWTKCPFAILPLIKPSHPFDLIDRSNTRLPTAARFSAAKRWSSMCGPQWFIRRQRPTVTAIAADGASSMLDAVQGRDTSVRDTISKGRFVQGARHPRIFCRGHMGRGHMGRGHMGRGHIGRGHINPASTMLCRVQGQSHTVLKTQSTHGSEPKLRRV
jgi:hypothetical protein